MILHIHRIHKKHPLVFEIWKPVWLSGSISIQTVIIYREVWNVAEMEHWTVQYCNGAVKLFIKTESVTAIQHGFRQQFPRSDPPSWSTQLLWVSIWHPEGYVKDSKPGHPHLDQIPDNLEGVRDGISQSLHRLARQ